MKRIMTGLLALTLAGSALSGAAAETTLETILGAGTTQAFTQNAVKEDDVKTILQAGLRATSAINQQPWFFAAVTDPEVMVRLSSGGFGAPPAGMTPPAGAPQGAEGAPAGAPAGMPASSGPKAGVGDSPLAIVVYMDPNTKSPNPNFDCGLATQNLVLAAVSLGYGAKVVTSPTMTLNGEKHDELCALMGVDPAMQAVAVVLIGEPDSAVDGATGASVRGTLSEKTNIG
ncbi:MAG: nitroreductase family protein [Clostridia bacterium]|nr:nitroreductase family protein [Clostridia bacterium]